MLSESKSLMWAQTWGLCDHGWETLCETLLGSSVGTQLNTMPLSSLLVYSDSAVSSEGP